MVQKLLFSIFLLLVRSSFAQEPAYDYLIFANSRMEGSYFYSQTTWQTPSWVKNKHQKLPIYTTQAFTPGNSLELSFVNGKGGDWTARIFKPHLRGQDRFHTPTHLSFHLFIDDDKTSLEQLPGVQLLNWDSTGSGKVLFKDHLKSIVAKKWQQVKIPLSAFSGFQQNRYASCIGLQFAQNGTDGKEHRVFIDDIELITDQASFKITATPALMRAKGYPRHIDIEWKPLKDTAIKWVKIYRSTNGKNFVPVAVQWPQIHRYADFTGVSGKTFYYKISFLNKNYEETHASVPLSAATRPVDDEELLTMAQEACFRYYWEGSEPFSGLARENILGRRNMIATGASGFGLMALVAGTERGFITREQAVDRFLKVVNFLEKADKFHGAFPHFLDGPTAKVEPFFGPRDNGGDLVETSFLMQGLLTARAYFNGTNSKEKEIRDKISRIWEGVEWSWYRRFPDSKFLYWHWSPDQEWVINHRLIGWNETMITYLLAIASPTHSVPASLYYTGWANQDSTGQQYRSAWGGTMEGAKYTNGNTYFGVPLEVGVSNGGPLFFTHYSYLGFDPRQITDAYTNYFTNNRHIALINYRYCLENPGGYAGYSDSCWGLTASDGPYGYSADEPVMRQDRGKMAPTGAVSSFPYTPVESMEALKNYYYHYGKFLWGEYGFRDAFNLEQNWCSEIYMGLNQAPMVVMIENFRTGLLWKLFMSNPEMQKVLDQIKHKE
jgi:exo beta-1,2-glucooligosaccharide sophorohydrolase (non-reducing end)